MPRGICINALLDMTWPAGRWQAGHLHGPRGTTWLAGNEACVSPPQVVMTQPVREKFFGADQTIFFVRGISALVRPDRIGQKSDQLFGMASRKWFAGN